MDLINNPLLVVLAGIAIVALIFWYIASEIDRRKRNVGTAAIILVIGLCLAAVLPVDEKLKGGIDLVGGTSFTVEIQEAKVGPDEDPIPVGPEAIEAVKATLGERLSAGSMAGAQMQGLGTNRLIIEMAGIDEETSERVKDIILRTAILECKAVHPENSRLAQAVHSGSQLAPAGWKKYMLPILDDDRKEIGEEPILLSTRNIVTGDLVQRATAVPGRFGTIAVLLSKDGGDRLYTATKQMRTGVDRMAVVLDGEALIAPTVNGNLSRDFIIEGLDGTKEVQEVVAALANPLKNPLLILSENKVTAKYGEEVIRQGVTAAVAGLIITLIFVLLYYRFAGVIALLGLSLNILILFGAMAMFGATFTLPGIAGIILTIGIAVDANVLIYERLREEMNEGKSVFAALKAAYEKAFTAIFDANITTLLTAIILLWRASDQIKGFAITLTIGILASMFAALLGTRVLFYWFAGTGGKEGALKKLSFMNLIPSRTIKFMQMRNPAFIISALLLVGALVTIGTKRDSALGIDFVGGAQLTIQVDTDHDISVADIDSSLSDIDLTKVPSAQKEIIAGGDTDLLRVKVSEKDVDVVIAELLRDLPVLAEKDESGEYVTPISENTIQPTLGKEFFKNSLWALGFGLIAVLGYISLRFEFSFAVGAFVALFHDLLIAIGAVLIIGTELSMIHVGAFLTIAGYSINDTIVVFDRVRETLRSKRGKVIDVMNLAINATLSRTILTSATTFMAVLVLYIFGGAALKDFSFAIMIGVVVGTYSSIFVASPVVMLWSKARGTNLRRELLDANLEAEVNPAHK